MLFIPNKNELNLISTITTYCRNDYALVRLTHTMLEKHIIDASTTIRTLLKSNNLIDYNLITPGKDKIKLDGYIITDAPIKRKLSFYRPKTKKGDPRFWISKLKQLVNTDDMIYITVYNDTICIIPLVESLFNENAINNFFNSNDNNADLIQCLNILRKIMHKDILSVSPYKSYPKDVGDTLEKCLNIKPNSDKHADFNNQIEIKGKRKGKKTKDTLFSMVPNWDISNISSSAEMIIKYGYPSTKHPGFIDLYVTVSNTCNNQGLSLYIDEDNEVLIQKYTDASGKQIDLCVWIFEDLKNRLNLKHPETLWVLAEEKSIDNKIYFNYESIQHTKSPIFNSFLLLISQGIITYDWRGRVKPDGTCYKDKGHCFRLNPKYRELLFGKTEFINL